MTHNTQKGFTMIEMIVVLGIFAMVSGIVLFNYGKFRNDTILTNMAYEVALSLREAQIYGVSVRSPGGGTQSFSQAYGVYFPTGESNQYLLFTDDGDRTYDGNTCMDAGDDVCITPYTLLGNIKITDVVIERGSGCVQNNDALSILFKRPNPEPVFSGNNPADSRAQITITSADGTHRYVVVSINGQISVVNKDICD